MAMLPAEKNIIMNLKLKKELCGRIYPLLRRSLGRLPPWIPMFRKELCAPRLFVPSVHSVSKMSSIISVQKS